MTITSRAGEQASQVPRIAPVPAGVKRPLWSVMIPTFNCAGYLRQALESVLVQDLGPQHMQIEVVDDASTKDSPEAVVREVGRGRVQFYRKLKNEGAVENFNACIQRSIGRIVHILHGDDFVASGFYKEIVRLTERYPDLGLYATRCFLVDRESIIWGMTARIPTLEMASRTVDEFFYSTPIQFSGTAVRRTSYEALGGFRHDLVHTADCEMWARIVAADGGIVSNEILASYREFVSNDSGRLAKSGENIRDICRLNEIFLKRYPGFSLEQARASASNKAWRQFVNFKKLGDHAAAKENHRLWVELTPFWRRLLRRLLSLAVPYIRRAVDTRGL